MEPSFKKQANKFLHQKKKHTRYIVVLACLAVVVAAATFATLHFSGQAQTHKQKVLACQVKAHAHEKDCYDKDGKVVCGQADYLIHQHNDDCYDQEGVLVCQLPEIELHEHDEACYTKERVLICGEEESEEHQHTEACYGEEKVLSCEELDELHTHDEKDCYETDDKGNKILTCEKTVLEEHVHGDECFKIVELTDAEINGGETPDQDVSINQGTAPEEEGDKVVVFPTQSCYDEDGEVVCGLEEHEHSDACYDEDGEAICGLLEHAHITPEEVVEEAQTEQLQKVYQDESVIVTAVYDSTANIPEEAELRAYAVTEETEPERYEQRVEEALAVTGLDSESSQEENSDNEEGTPAKEPQVLVYNIGFFIGDEEIEPEAPVTITIQFLDAEGLALGDPITVIHFGEQGPQVFDGTLEEGATTTFETDGFSDFVIVFPSFAASTNSNGTANIAAVGTGTKYKATFVNYWELKENEDYVLVMDNSYTVNGKKQILFISADYAKPVAIYQNITYSAGKSFEWTGSDMSDSSANLVWQIYGKNNNLSGGANDYAYLQSQADKTQYLRLNYGSDSDKAGTGRYINKGDAKSGGGTYTQDEANNANAYLKLHIVQDGIGAKIQTSNDKHYLCYAQDGLSPNNGFDGWDWSASSKSSDGAKIYFAKIQITSENYQMSSYEQKYPAAAETRLPSLNRDSFYNVRVEADGLHAVPGCKFKLTNTATGATYYVESKDTDNSMQVKIPNTVPVGTYEMVEVEVPNGYVLNPEKWIVQVKRETMVDTDGVSKLITTVTMKESSTDKQIGIVFNYVEGVVDADKTAEYVNFEDRAYRVDITAASEALTYISEPINVSLIVDQSNSMLFPADLVPTGISVDITATGNNANLNGKLNKDEVYYLIAEPKGKATVYAVWWGKTGNGENDGSWLFQDAAYYAKAQHGEPEGGVYVGYPRVNAASMNAELGTRSSDGALVKAFNGADLDKCSSRGDFTPDTYPVYKAVPESNGKYYNRLTYLEESMAGLICELATLNPESRVSLEQFNKRVLTERCISRTLNEAGVRDLIRSVGVIDTEGGTRQDLALQHAIDSKTYTVDSSGKFVQGNSCGVDHLPNDYRNYVVLITDGAPVGITYKDATELITYMTPYANAVKNLTRGGYKVTLATIGLSVANVVGGAEMLEAIASEGTNGEEWSWDVEQSSGLTEVLLGKFFDQVAVKIKISPIAGGNVQDIISDSFYLYDPANPYTALEEGTWITLEGAVTTKGSPDAVGQVHYKDGECYVDWLAQEFPARFVEGDYIDTGTNKFADVSDVMGGNVKPAGHVFKDSAGNLKVGWYNLSHEREPNWENIEAQIRKETGGYWTKEDYVEWWFGVKITKTRDVWVPAKDIDAVAKKYYAEITDVPDVWHGTLYLKAKEDFIGGNAIDTNKEARIAITDASIFLGGSQAKSNIYLPTPTVNVRLLPLTNMNSEVTVFLGDIINGGTDTNVFKNSPLESLQYLYRLVKFEKLEKGQGTGNIRNYKKWSTAYDTTDVYKSLCDEDYFNLQYAIERAFAESPALQGSYTGYEDWLTNYLWKNLAENKTVKLDYTYDNASSHGAVGYFTFSIKKEDKYQGADHTDHSAWGTHEAEDVGDHVEAYTLTVTYTAYTLNERNEALHKDPSCNDEIKNQYNNEIIVNNEGVIKGNTKFSEHTHEPGPEVKKANNRTLETGYGETTSTNVHWVNVVAGRLEGVKTIAKSMVSSEPQTFTICLQRAGAGGEAGECVLEVPVEVTAGAESATFSFENVPRGEYIIHEHIEDGAEYRMKGYTIEKGTGTNYYVDSNNHIHVGFYYDEQTKQVEDVIHYIDYTETGDPTEGTACLYQVTHNPNAIQYSTWKQIDGILKAIVNNIKKGYEIQLLKVSMEDINEPLEGAKFELYAEADFDESTGKPKENAQPIWTGTSTVTMVDGKLKGGWDPEMEDPLDVGIYYLVEKEAPEKHIMLKGAIKIDIDGEGNVHTTGLGSLDSNTLTPGADGTILIKIPNATDYKLPDSGGLGTTPYTTGALILIVTALAALMYKTLRSRRRDKRA